MNTKTLITAFLIGIITNIAFILIQPFFWNTYLNFKACSCLYPWYFKMCAESDIL